MDFATIVGMLVALYLMVDAIGVSALGNFVDMPSVKITIGGAFCCIIMMQPSIPAFFKKLSSFKLVIKKQKTNEQATIKSIIDLSNVARKEGLLALEEAANGIDDAFLKKGILLVVDGTDPELVRSIMETELDCMDSRHKNTAQFWDAFGAMGPAWGMIGTLIGLINMLGALSDMASVGPNMAVALITTFYGSLISNWICTPVATKLRANNAAEMMNKEILVEGLLSIQAGENPRVIEEKLKSFLAPKAREAMNTEGGGEAAAPEKG